MLDFGFYNDDCLPRMKEYPDNYFDLAVVDPPYGTGISEDSATPELGIHFHGRGRSKKYQEIYAGSVESPETPKNLGGGWSRFGQRFDRYKNPQAITSLHLRTSEEGQKLREPEELGQRNMQKNHCVGCRAGAGVF